jgi:hypothetical protein
MGIAVKSGLVVAAACLLAAVSAATASNQGRPALSLVSERPVVLAGSGFRPGERVRVRVSVGGKSFAKRLAASRGGRFRARFAQANTPDCALFVASAVGGQGSRATLRYRTFPPPCGADPG